jgi:hypothetical protein
MKNVVSWMRSRVGLVKTDISKERIASIFNVKRISDSIASFLI